MLKSAVHGFLIMALLLLFIVVLTSVDVSSAVAVPTIEDVIHKRHKRQTQTSCPNDQFRCNADGTCIPYSWQCDGIIDCFDGQDEDDDCFICDNGMVILRANTCNGIMDCIGGEDEQCFTCDDGQTIPHTNICNGVTDCTSGEDEECFACGGGHFILQIDTCNGVSDCSDSKDEGCCDTPQFLCGSDECILESFRCDGVSNCLDGSDEANNCSFPAPCQNTEFQCNDGSCIRSDWLCDDVLNDCPDNGDENCFTCDNGDKIPQIWQCDGVGHCADNSDEMSLNCPSTPAPCQNTEFQCYDGSCIRSDWLCDTINDCPDNGDENCFTCDDGDKIPQIWQCDGVGHCADNSDEMSLNCPKIRCDALTQPANGYLVCASAPRVGDVCYIGCNNGYRLTGSVAVLECLQDGNVGRWSQDSANADCQDMTPPQFQPACPYQRIENIETPCDNEMIVTFDLPTPIDDSQPVTVSPDPFAEILDVGIHQRVFAAWDIFYNIAQCTISINVIGFDCGYAPAAPLFGDIVSETCNEVTYECDYGYRLVGDSHLQCANDGSWNNSVPVCEEIRCDALTQPANGYLVCASAPRVGDVCYIGCNNGYRLTGSVAVLECLQDGNVGRWSQDSVNADCQDISRPIIDCPNNIDVELSEDASIASVSWRIPTATIQSGQSVDVFYNNSNSVALPVDLGNGIHQMDLGYGKHRMEYFAYNVVGQNSYCRFTVDVLDTHTPKAVRCPSEAIEVVSTTLPVLYSWIAPHFTDNVGVVEVTNDTESVDRYMVRDSWDPTTVTYTARDAAGNTAQCVYIFKASNSSECSCPSLDRNPPNATLQCDSRSCKSCSIICADGTVALTRTPSELICTKRGVEPRKSIGDILSKPSQPQGCAPVEDNNSIVVNRSHELLVKGYRACDINKMTLVKTRVESILIFKTKSTCDSDKDSTCTYKVQTKCKTPNGRTRRQTEANDELLVEVEVKVVKTNSINATVAEKVMAMNVSDLFPGDKLIVDSDGQNEELDIVSNRSGPIKPHCNASQDAAGVRCVPCPAGTSYNLKLKGCLPCKTGEYQHQKGQLICSKCPLGKSTLGTGSYNDEYCKDVCDPGYYSYSGLQPDCQLCPVGTYQPRPGQRQCIRCPAGQTSFQGTAMESSCFHTVDNIAPVCSQLSDITVFIDSGASSTSVSFTAPEATDNSGTADLLKQTHKPGDLFQIGTTRVCYHFSDPSGNTATCCFDIEVLAPCDPNPCQNGGNCAVSTASADSYACSCPPLYTGNNCETPVNLCETNSCLNDGLCQIVGGITYCFCTGGYSGNDCSIPPYTPCTSNPCVNQGTCVVSFGGTYQCSCPDGFSGDRCQNTPCTSNPCVNQGTCVVSFGGTYQCSCPDGFSGDRCQNTPCTSNPCVNQGTCVVSFGGTYQCSCPDGFSGDRCQNTPCTSNPCVNQGTCVVSFGGTYQCSCPDGFSGDRCQNTPCTSNPCVNQGTCVVSFGGTYQCSCPDGFSGDHCQNTPCTSNPCVNQGTCVVSFGGTYQCSCPDGFSGDRCQNTPCTYNPCQNGGQCQIIGNTFGCHCPAGFLGDRCQITPCTNNPCQNQGRCQIIGSTFQCSCPTGFSGDLCQTPIPPPPTTKTPLVDTIFVTDLDRAEIYSGQIDTLELERIPLQNIQRPVAIDFDPLELKIYWTDVTRGDISRASLDGSNQEVVISSLIIPDGISLDTINRWLFWTEAGDNQTTGTIGKSNLDGSSRQVIIANDLDQPRAIVAESAQRRLFWTDWGTNARIERANMDGSGRIALVSTDLVYPNGLAIDFQGETMYWCDAEHNVIEVADLNGLGRQIVAFINNIDIHPFDIGIYNNHLYWSDWNLANLVRMNRYTGHDPTVIGPSIFNKAGGMHIYQTGGTRKRRDLLDMWEQGAYSANRSVKLNMK